MVKSVYVMVHATAGCALAARQREVSALLAGNAEDAQAFGGAAAVAAVKQFWQEELPNGSKPAAHWQSLLKSAHGLPNPTAGEVALRSYLQAVGKLREGLALMLRGRP